MGKAVKIRKIILTRSRLGKLIGLISLLDRASNYLLYSSSEGKFIQLMELSVVSIIVFSFLLGLKHAVEVDHLVAVSTIVAERKSIFTSTIIGGFWGIGHTIALLVARAGNRVSSSA